MTVSDIKALILRFFHWIR